MKAQGGLLAVAVVASLATTAAAHGRLEQFATAGAFEVSQAEARVVAALEERVRQGEAANPGVLSRLAGLRLTIALRTRQHEDYAAAARHFERWSALAPRSASAWEGLSRAQLGRHGFAAARDAAQRSVALAPERAAAWLLLGDVHHALGSYAEAEATYLRAEVLSGPTLASRARVAQMQTLRGRDEAADRAWFEAIAAGEALGARPAALAWCWSQWAELAAAGGDVGSAAIRYRRALELDPQNSDAGVGLAHLEVTRDQAADAVARLRALEARAPRPRVWLALASAHAALDEPKAAAVWRRKAERDLVGDLRRGELGHLRELGELWLAAGRVEAALELFERDLRDVRQDATGYTLVARSLVALDRPCPASRAIASAIATGSREPRLMEHAIAIEQVARAAGCNTGSSDVPQERGALAAH